MKLVYSERFLKALQAAPPQVQKAFLKQSEFLLNDLRHPSLRAKKFNEALGLWQARVNRGWRFYFTYRRQRVPYAGPHPAPEVVPAEKLLLC